MPSESEAVAPVVETPQAQVPQTPAVPAQSATAPVQNPSEEVASTVLTESERAAYTEEFQNSGTLSDASFDALEKKGLPRAMVESYLKGCQMQMQAEAEELTKGIGGMQRFTAIKAWAETALTPQQKEDFNLVLKSDNRLAITASLEKLNAMYQASNPQPPERTVMGNPTQSQSQADIFHSREEMASAMSSEDYWKNPEAQRKVAEKIQRSLAAGVKF